MPTRIDPSEHSQQIYQLFQAAYRVEADLIGVQSFPPLERSAQEIGRSESYFYGEFHMGELAAVIETEAAPGANKNDILSLAVAPSSARQGLGMKLVQFILQSSSEVVVTTAYKNQPAIQLYQKLGFAIVREFDTPEQIVMVEMSYS